MSIENERQRQKELYEYVATAHMLSFLVLASALVLNKNMFAQNIYPVYNIRLFLLVGLIGFLVVMFYSTKTSFVPSCPRSLSWVDLGYVIFPSLAASLTLFTVGENLSSTEIILLVPILIAASVKGKPAGLAMATVCAALVICHRLFFLLEGSVVEALESSVTLLWLMYIVGWFIGGLADIEAHHRKQISFRVEKEKLIAWISTKFNNLALAEVDGGINYALKALGEFADADRSYIFLFSDDGTKVSNTYEWCARGIEPQIDRLQGLAAGDFPWWMERLRRFEDIAIPRVADLPDQARAEKEILQAQDIKSLYAVPLVYGKTLVGFLGLDAVRAEKTWPKEIVSLIRIIGEIIANALERKRAEERFCKAFNASPNPMAMIACPDGRFIDVNDSFQRVTGYGRQEVVGRFIAELDIWLEQKERAKIMEVFQRQERICNLEVNFHTRWGRPGVGLLSSEIINLNGEQCMLVVLNDITERKQLEKEIARLERLNLVGEMAAGMGHEIRNPMTTVRGFLQILGAKKECLPYKEYFNLMIEELDRINQIITEFLFLAKNKAIDLKAQNLNAVLKALSVLIEADAVLADKSVRMELGNIPDLLLDEKEIRQLILNLVRNGLEAMPPGGTLAIKTFQEGEETVLAVRDEGPGIEPDLLEKIGTPFFTTKDNGTGLGLAVCYSIAARHKAAITVETGPAGTTFFVRFKQNGALAQSDG